MSEAGPSIGSLRPGRREIRPLEWAIVLSLLFHLAVWGGYALGKKQGWWDRGPLAVWLHRLMKPPEPLVPTPAQPAEQVPQLSFIQVADADAEAPKVPKFYANKNSHAANETVEPDQDTPKLNGQQTDMVRTETARRTHITKSQPPQPVAPPVKEQTQEVKEQTKPLQPQPVVQPGDLDPGKPQELPQQNQPQQPPRPRTLRQALAQLPSQIQGLQMRQAGGVHRVALRASFDAKETLFGDYDSLLTQAIQQKWDDLLDARNFAGDRSGRVEIHFYLNYDGTVTEAKIASTTVDMTWAYLCQQAVTEPAPFAKWPDEMRREIGGNTREMTFTFYYY